jgi:hypothetical protein
VDLVSRCQSSRSVANQGIRAMICPVAGLMTPIQLNYLPIAGTRLMSARACPLADGPTHCISRALAAPRSPTVQPDFGRCQLPVLPTWRIL